MIAIGSKIYVGLGDDALGNRKDWWMYSITANTWIQITDLPGAERHHPYMFNAGGKVFAGLGHSGSLVYKDWYKLDPTSNTWTPMNTFPGEGRVAGTQFSHNGLGYVLSGDGDNHDYMDTGEMWRYDPFSDAWSQLTPHPGQSRWAPGSFVINDDVYFFGGLNRLTGAFPTDLWKYSLASFVGIDEKNLPNTYAYPNPANDFLSWSSDDNITDVSIYNTMGQLIFNSPIGAKNIVTKDMDNGLYFVKFLNESILMKTTKVLIQH
jgi:N-acetylneuraminic acid mutarotase